MNKKPGRPSKYTPELVEQTAAYIKNYESHGDLVPSIKHLALVLGVAEKTLYNWVRKHEEFDFLLEQLLCQQELVLINKGLSGEFNSVIVKLMLAKHGYHSKQHVTHSESAIEVRRTIVHGVLVARTQQNPTFKLPSKKRRKASKPQFLQMLGSLRISTNLRHCYGVFLDILEQHCRADRLKQ